MRSIVSQADLDVLGSDAGDDVRNFADGCCVFRAGQLTYKASAR